MRTGSAASKPTPSASISIPFPGNRSRYGCHPDEAVGPDQGDADYKQVAEQVYLATDTRKVMTDMGLTPPPTSYKSFSVMGKSFDPASPEDYLNSFKIRKAS